MSELTDALELLDYWLSKNHPQVFDRLPLGLEKEEIDKFAQELNFELPQEVKELYEWRNGCRPLFWSAYTVEPVYLPIDRAIRLDVKEDYSRTRFIENYLLKDKKMSYSFSLFDDDEMGCRFVDCESDNHTPILYVDGEDCYSVICLFSSITSIVLTTLESYQQEIIHFGQYGMPTVNDEDEDEYKKVWLKHNLNLETFLKQKYMEDYIKIHGFERFRSLL